MSTYTADYTDDEKEAIELIANGDYIFSKERGCYVGVPRGCRDSDKIKERDLDFFIGFLVRWEMNARR